MSMVNGLQEIRDFSQERERHGALLGRGEVLAKLDELLLGNSSRGWVLVKGGPGVGKSALLNEWLKRREAAGHRVPHHFLRRGVQDWDQPEVVKRNLAAQVEALYPKQADPEARPESRLDALLVRVSKQVLLPRQEHLVLLVDGLDEVYVEEKQEASTRRSSPLQSFLPHVLPPGVKVLCASRPTYPYLSWLEAQDGVHLIDLDSELWAGSNRQVVREYWERERLSPRFKMPLESSFVEEIVRRAEGNVLYAVKLAEWLEDQPVDKRRVELLPRGLEALLDESWERIQEMSGELRSMAEEGLGVLAVAREALPRSVLALVAGWKERGDVDRFLRVARSFLLEEVTTGSNEKAWRPFHEFFRNFILSKLGTEGTRALHARLAEHLCQWPVKTAERDFRWRYALRHGVPHWLKAEQWEQARKLYADMGYLEKQCQEAGVLAVEEVLKAAVLELPAKYRERAKALHRAIQVGSHVLRKETKALPLYVYNWLRCSGWGVDRLKTELMFPEGLPELRLRHPVRAGGSERTLENQWDWMTGCTVTPDGRRVVSASGYGTLKVWELETGQEVSTLDRHGDWVSACAVTPDGRRVVSASWDKTLKVWELETGREVSPLKGHGDRVNGCVVTPDGRSVVSASDDGTLKVWELETGRQVATLEGHRGIVNSCAVTPDGRRVVSASEDETLRVWDFETGRWVATLEGHSAGVSGCAVTPDGQRVVSASADGTLKVWDVRTGQAVATLEGHRDVVNSCTVTPDGCHVVSASWDKTLKVWELETGKEVITFEGHGDVVSGCAVTPDGRRVVSASWDGTLKVWELGTGQQVIPPDGHSDVVNGCAVTPDGQRVVSASEDGTLRMWDLETGRQVAMLEGHSSGVKSCAVTPDGRRAVSTSDDRTLKVWDLETGREVATLKGYKTSLNACVMTPDGRHIVTASRNGTLKVWELDTGRQVVTLKDSKICNACAVTPDGRRVVSALEGGTLKVWELETGQVLATMEGHGAGVNGCAVTPDGRRVVSTSWDQTLKVWELETGQEVATLRGHGSGVSGCAVTPDGQRVVSGSWDKTLKVWDLSSCQCLYTLYGFTAFIAVAAGADVICAGDVVGNIWILETSFPAAQTATVLTKGLPSPSLMNFSFPPPVLDAYCSKKLALCVGSGLSLGKDVQGNFPTWKELPNRFIDACERYGVADTRFIRKQRSLFEDPMSLEDMLSMLGVLRTKLGQDYYQRALNEIFRPRNASPGEVHRAMARLGVPAMLTTNFDPLIEEVAETPRRAVYTRNEAHQALHDLESGRSMLLKIHGTAERADTVVMTELEYHQARTDRSYQAVLSHLFKDYTVLFVGYGMNDPLDIDLVMQWNAEVFRTSARRHYALMKQPSDKEPRAAEWDRYQREFNVQVIGYRDHAEVPSILDELARAAAP